MEILYHDGMTLQNYVFFTDSSFVLYYLVNMWTIYRAVWTNAAWTDKPKSAVCINEQML